MDVMQKIQALLSTANAPIPPIPKEMTCLLSSVEGSEYFSSRADAPSPWNIRWYMDELMKRSVSSYLVTGFAGHGVASRAVHYYLVSPDIALFHQSILSSPYGQGATSEDLQQQYDLAASVIIAAEDAKAVGKMNKNSRLVIVHPSSSVPMWGVQQIVGKPVDEWHQDSHALVGAANWLANLT